MPPRIKQQDVSLSGFFPGQDDLDYAPEAPKKKRVLKIVRKSPEEKAKEYAERVEQYGGERRKLAETIGERELRILREKEAIRREREKERATKQELQKTQREQEKQQRIGLRQREEQLLNIVPAAYTGKRTVRQDGRLVQEETSLEAQRKRQERQLDKLFPEEPTGRSQWLYNLKPLKPSALDIQQQKKKNAITTLKRKSTMSGQPFVPIYNT